MDFGREDGVIRLVRNSVDGADGMITLVMSSVDGTWATKLPSLIISDILTGALKGERALGQVRPGRILG